MNDAIKEAWIDAAKKVLSGERQNLLCPVRQDGYLAVQWIPFRAGGGGEYQLRCPVCGAENFILKREVDQALSYVRGTWFEPVDGIRSALPAQRYG